MGFNEAEKYASYFLFSEFMLVCDMHCLAKKEKKLKKFCTYCMLFLSYLNVKFLKRKWQWLYLDFSLICIHLDFTDV